MIKILPGQIFKHFKGGVYEVLGVSEGDAKPFAAGTMISAIDTESAEGTQIGFMQDGGKRIWAPDGKQYVIYQKPSDALPWARPLDMFLGEKEPGIYRFTLYSPGSDAARADGCTCPVMENGHGCRVPPYWINENCPIHGKKQG